MLKDLLTQLLRVGVQFVKSAAVLRTLVLAVATLSALDVFAIHTGRAVARVTQRSWHIVQGVGCQFCALPVRFAVLTKIEARPVRERI